MRAKELDHKEVLDLDPDRGLIHFAGRRALILDAEALGVLRKYLVENFGLSAARTLLTQFGFAHGWRVAEAVRSGFTMDSEDDWLLAATRIHALGGHFHVESACKDPLVQEGIRIVSSYEAEQHILHFGRSDAPTCWTISGILSGYLSRIAGEDIFVLEDRCTGRNDSCCHLTGKTREAWGDDRANELGFFESERIHDCLDVSLQRVTDTLKAAEGKLKSHRQLLEKAVPSFDDPLGLVAKSEAMRQVLDWARRLARVDATVLITGESGAGKERIARFIHNESTRAAGPFVAVNCGAITETLLESELFGHVRGSFTGATHDRAGLFEAAHQGTLLMDEIGEISPGMQIKLLRAIQEREIRRVGENRSRRVDVRILAATNRDLAASVSEGSFRQDLYYRLKVVELNVPPLRERREDILPLARQFLAASALRMKRQVSGLASGAASHLLNYPWPGNVRELENTMERAVALARGSRVESQDLPVEVCLAIPRPHATTGTVLPLEAVEKDHILAVLKLNGGNQARTAEQLKISPVTLYRRLKSYGMLGREAKNR
ncbi:MAG: sigma-54-dependent Fis family transcriptional regulator [Geothrix sp.]|uniref:sigma-54-dependent Fis family transcriptional regulator n=1 Tax=Geothrix sp. TaxID=1962974 RepID=UPI00184574F0|nr:sigma-54-dependent Fis family transcriptional regulator [Geothrix sp.]NWJ41038.1 sigma-54-dependent Fis family transcriptional regulator [Geothrix sp.]WIL20965.1 MAG: sigma-54-dependent Fis family transcriptional regulator [Geothrix sp.]